MGNKFFGKLFRLIGFILIGVASIFAALNIFNQSSIQIDFLMNLQSTLKGLPLLDNDNHIIYLFFGGLSLLVWTLSKRIFTKIVFQVFVLVLAALELSAAPTLLGLQGTFDLFDLSQIIDPVVNEPYIHLGVVVVILLFVWWLLNVRRPKRAFVSILRFALFILVFATILNFLPIVLPNDFFTAGIYPETILPIVHTIPYVFIILSSVFAILGVFAK